MKVLILVAVLAAFVCGTQARGDGPKVVPNTKTKKEAPETQVSDGPEVAPRPKKKDGPEVAPEREAAPQGGAAPQGVAGRGYVMVDAGSSGSKIMSYDEHRNVAPKRAVETDCFTGPGPRDRDLKSQRGVAAIGAYQKFEGFCDAENGDLQLRTLIDDEEQTKKCAVNTQLPETGPKDGIVTPQQYKELLIKVIKARHEKRCDCGAEQCGKDKTCIMQDFPGHTDCTPLGPPKNQQFLTMQATAGMRVLPKKLNDDVWGGICNIPFEGYKFDVYGKKCGTIPGAKEAFFEYVAAVEASHVEAINAGKPFKAHLRGTFTVGGASAQIAFPITSPETQTAFTALRTQLKGSVFKNCESVQLPLCKKFPDLCKGMDTHVPWFADPEDCSKDFIDFYDAATITGMLPPKVAERVLKAKSGKILGLGLISFLGLDGSGNEDSKWIGGGMDAIDRFAKTQGCGQDIYRNQNSHCVSGKHGQGEIRNTNCKKYSSKERCENAGKDQRGLTGQAQYTQMGSCKWIRCAGPPGCSDHESEVECAKGIAVKLAPASLSGNVDQQLGLGKIPGLRMDVCHWDAEGSEESGSDAQKRVKNNGKTARQCDGILAKGLKWDDKFYKSVSKFFRKTLLHLDMLSFNTNNAHPVALFYNEKAGDQPYSEPLIKDAKDVAGVDKNFLNVEQLRPTKREDLSKVAATLSLVCQAICDSYSQFNTGDGIGYKEGRSCFSCMYMARFIVDFFPKDSTRQTPVDTTGDVDVAAGMLENAMKVSFKSLRGRKRKAQTLSRSAAMLRSKYPDLYAHPNFHTPIQFHSTTYADGMAATFE